MHGAGCLGGVDYGLVLGHAAAYFGAGDQEELGGSGEGRGQGFRPLVVRFADLHAAGGEPGRLLGRADGGDDLSGGHAAVKQVLHNQAAQVAGGTGNDDGHLLLSF